MVREVLDSRWFTNDGERVRALERKVAEIHEVEHCVATANGTLALELVLAALDLPPGGEVILPAHTFIATAHAVRRAGLRPVFCDIDEKTLTMDPAEAERLVTSKTAAFLPVHVFCRPCDTEAFASLGARYGIPVVYDAAHCFAGRHHGRPFGRDGCAEVLSFHATKVFSTFEGGAVLTNDAKLADRLRRLRNFGFVGEDHVVDWGVNAKMHEISASFGLAALPRLADRIAHKRALHETYRAAFAGARGLHFLVPPPDTEPNYHYAVLLVDEEAFGATRDEVKTRLHASGVFARRYFYPGCHRMAPYADVPPHTPRPLVRTERLLERILCLPTGTEVRPEDASRVSEIVLSTARS